MEGRNPFFGFGNMFPGFDDPSSFMSGFFGGANPFSDPFFTQPLGGMFSSNFLAPGMNPFPPMHPPPMYQQLEPATSRGPIIEEIDSESDDEKEEAQRKKKRISGKHPGLGNESSGVVTTPDDDDHNDEETNNAHVRYMSGNNNYSNRQLQLQRQPQPRPRPQPQPQTQSFVFQSSSSVTYGGADGAYYTSSMARRTGSDGVTFEESREADYANRQAAHRVSRGLHSKGHTVARKLNSDGRVDTMQTLHNLNENELVGFDNAWNVNASKVLPIGPGNFSSRTAIGAPGSSNNRQVSQRGWALPSTVQGDQLGRAGPSPVGRGGDSSTSGRKRTK